jgi:SAM-dependent methyltransferase
MSEADNYNSWIFERSRPFLGSRVLDVGAGIGTFVERAATCTDLVVALEPDPAYVPLLRARFRGWNNVHVVHGEAENSHLAKSVGPFDSVTCFNVLEHIRSDGEALAAFAQALAPGGHLLLLAPAHPLLFGETDRVLGHERRYRQPQLRLLLESAGFTVVALRHVNPLGALGWLVSSRLLHRRRVPRGPLALFDRLVPLLRLVDRIDVGFGLSLWAVARRSP